MLGAIWLHPGRPAWKPVRFSESMGRTADTAAPAVPDPARPSADGRPGAPLQAHFSEGLAPVLVASKWGYVDTSGRMAITPSFEWAGPFREGLAMVADSGGYRFIDTAGDSLGGSVFSDARPFSEGMAAVRFGKGEDGAWGFIDRRGRLAIPPLFADVPTGFSEGLAAVLVGGEGGGRTGFIDTSGGFAMDSLFDAAGDFSEGVAPVARGEILGGRFRGTWSYVDRSGKRALPGDFAWGGNFEKGSALVKRIEGRFDIIDRSGNVTPSGSGILIPIAAMRGGIVTYKIRIGSGAVAAAGGRARGADTGAAAPQ